jgi:phenylalanyl-tRNA synthetase beta chain
LIQKPHIAAVIAGNRQAENWTEEKNTVDFYDIKGDLQSLISMSRPQDFEFRPTANEIMHPGQGADIYCRGELVGFVGALHPNVLRALDIDQKLFVFEIELQALQSKDIARFKELSKFPSIRRDLALTVDQNVTAQQLIDSINSLQSKIIQDVFVFDVYTGKEVINFRKSVALGLILQDFSRTLTDQDVEETQADVLQILEKQQNAVLR